MICLHPKNLQNLEIDKIAAEILREIISKSNDHGKNVLKVKKNKNLGVD